ncbi:hypothetical protein LGL55_19425 [Clostridium tagluense]|uniref:hypothetical protein n=1 Tax=Clostridium tagluense TaxID=360422 RepID=UPI001C0AFFD5|nr:hypothetical protein [Clostridium tagluense]MBU3129951.1 hypothetical protein [Clostridium tagluense]MCB2311968.1 hypothetical protein [Clostridium tagluense]MCB2318121.1 hypothetical protein [Clostridium tagluense]MCB2323342.1 hypothetical protein [Clostridium tagluense]MCB2327905.1 hypothetical protein [Clostridium tagluense]
MKMNKTKWIITIINILILLFTWIYYGKFNTAVCLWCSLLIFNFLQWHFSDKAEKKENEKNNSK